MNESSPIFLEIPTVALCVIAKNEAKNLPKCLKHARKFDKCLVVDTGSTDGSQEIARSLGAEVVPFEWCDDFSKARNVWHEHIKKGWIFWLDADDEIDEGLPVALLELAAAAPEDVLAFRFNYCYPNGYQVDHMRLYRADRGIQWFRRIHEGLKLWDHAGRTMHSNWSVFHTGYDSNDKQAMESRRRRNEALLRQMVEDDPSSALDWQYLAMHRQDEGRHEEAIEFFKKALANSKKEFDFTWLPELYINMARSYTKLGKPGKAKEIMWRGVKDCGKNAFAYYAEKQLAVRTKSGQTIAEVVQHRHESLLALSR